MTNKDAEVVIRQLATNLSIIPSSKTGEAITLALKALKQEPNEDAISREKALRTMCANCDDWQTCKMDCQRRKSILALPPVNPVKTGHWIENSNAYECSECHIIRAKGMTGKYNYCPNCGARLGDNKCRY